MDQIINQNVAAWLEGPFDDATKQEIKRLQAEDTQELKESFYKSLDFGTGGLRGIMGVGTNRMNKYTVGMATQGLANYVKQEVEGTPKAAIAYDCRNNSAYFAEVAANVLAATGFTVYLFDALRPTPELSFAIRELGCHTGIVITASHNPREYNGFKAYWSDGGQVVAPHDTNIVNEVRKIESIDDVNWEGGEGSVIKINKEVDEPYLKMLEGLCISPEAIKDQKDLKIVFTSIHGTGITMVPPILERLGFENVHIIEEQKVTDGNFPTVVYPNPEEAEALSMALAKAKEIDADILLGTDPDADRVGIAIKNHKGEWTLLNGNQTAALLFNYVISARKKAGLNKENDFVCKTIVTTDLIDRFAAAHNMPCYNVLTGFKFIAEVIKEKEGKENFIVGGEESYGYLIGDAVRDKDAIAASAMICEMAAFYKNEGKSMFDQLIDIYAEHGYFKEKLISITKKGMSGADEIAQMMKDLRSNPPATINGSKVLEMRDYQSSISTDLQTKEETVIDLPKSNVLQFLLEDGTKISARPSGTEPKIKFYFSVNTSLSSADEYDAADEVLETKVAKIIEDMKLN
ncbi:phospho-sugar mutase [Flammeovirga kamogawensis]|uniref:Phospho-sugar mutase n=1 Tax=Flammeovirga kamogawensis TaxID=373891 RepID=A0ABX8GYV3_9BACT|nr:phospho-sugar mutase [Flammeovirga kamogawensis]MBB6458937.1 phosphoglucomutase [Flammeovirga kamogawensis]QWG08513.1 phospho-sugar mutase [Flammeovirga kamogawensis]TRX66806.1 phospho-sugar mutase [Flammeovirga kamogawensis]